MYYKNLIKIKGKEYKVLHNGHYYPSGINITVIDIIEELYIKKTRVIVHVLVGKIENNRKRKIVGYIGFKTGKIKTPLILNKSNSIGGNNLDCHKIYSIEHSNKKEGQKIYSVI